MEASVLEEDLLDWKENGDFFCAGSQCSRGQPVGTIYVKSWSALGNRTATCNPLLFFSAYFTYFKKSVRKKKSSLIEYYCLMSRSSCYGTAQCCEIFFLFGFIRCYLPWLSVKPISGENNSHINLPEQCKKKS